MDASRRVGNSVVVPTKARGLPRIKVSMRVLGIAAITFGVSPSSTPALLITLAALGILSALYGGVILRRLRRN